jgi:hypothetical protein
MKTKKLLTQIEELRQALNQYNCETSLTDPTIIELSRRLDALLNEYCKTLQKKSIK